MLDIIREFALEGTPIGMLPFGSGHINKTWLVATSQSRLYILQCVNTNTFKDPVGLMNNIVMVTDHLKKKDPTPGHVLNLIPTRKGDVYILQPEQGLWRMYDYIIGGTSLNQAETPEDFRRSGEAFGHFQRQLADFPTEKLVETIPGFHDTPSRFRAFHEVIQADVAGRVSSARPEIDFYLEREKDADRLESLRRSGELPTRVTHNDTKLNNVILDEKTRKPLCILDLDTVMPGLSVNDFGDSIRFGASTAVEDEPDLDRVHLDLGLYQAYAEGFLSACGDSLTTLERELLPDGAWMMTLEVGLRFLTDYLAGDVYFHTEKPDHNLIRAHTQIRLVQEMETLDDQIRAMIRQL